MRNSLLVLSFAAAACGARAAETTMPIPLEYTCGATSVVRHDATVELREPTASAVDMPTSHAKLGWRDDAGDHFVTWPVSPTDVRAVEVIVPHDPRQDATARYYDTSTGTSTSDWRLVRKQGCTARGGYNDALAHYLRGDSYAQLAAELALDGPDEARDMVHRALLSLQRRYFQEH